MYFSCIVPAYNEGPRIAHVIRTLLAVDYIDEIIVINDGSTDDTAMVVNMFQNSRTHLIDKTKNEGKTKAVLDGVNTSHGKYIVMVDADLIGLRPEHIHALIAPIRDKNADTTLTLRENSLLICKWLGTDFLSGDRVLPRSLFDDASFLSEAHGYGLEILLNEKIIQNNLRIVSIYFEGVDNERKSTKLHSRIRGVLADWVMTWHLIRSVGHGSFWCGLPSFLYQLWYFSRFSGKMKK